MGFFVRHSEFKDIVTITRDNLIRQLSALEATSGVIIKYEKVIMANLKDRELAKKRFKEIPSD